MKNIAKKCILTVLSFTALVGTSALAADLSGWAVSEYQAANEAGLVSHSVVSQNLQEDITRQEFCELAMNLYKRLAPDELYAYKQASAGAPSPFTDTNSEVASWAYSFGVAAGTPTGEFAPNRRVTREEMAKMLVSVMCATELESFQVESSLSDSYLTSYYDSGQVSDWAKNSVKLALEYGLMNGINSYTLSPLGSVTREQAIATINRTYNKFRYSFEGSDYSVALPTILTPSNHASVTDGELSVSWTSVHGASSYHVIVKDANTNCVVHEEITPATSYTPGEGILSATRNYTLIVGAVLSDGSEVFSLPLDFTYKAKVIPTPAPERYHYDVTTGTSNFTEHRYENKPESNNNIYTAPSSKAQGVLDTAAQYLGVPYLWGGTTPSGFDCSGFVQYVMRQNGISITRTTYTQWDNDGTYVSRSELQPGDLVYFGDSSAPHHVGIYVGDGQYIHSPRTGDVVKYASLDSRKDFCGGKRVIY